MKKILIVISLLCFFMNVKATNTSTMVMDMDSKRILYQNSAYEERLIASTTKIMTFVIAYEYGRDFLDVYLEAGEEVLEMYGTSIYIKYGEKMLLRDLLYGLMLRSGNDAAVVIASFIGGSESNFVKLMNDKALKLGMNNTIFRNPHGLDEKTKNYSTAYDLALLSSYANTIPFYKEVVGTKYYKANSDLKAFSWTNRNNLLFMYKCATGGKTGYTPSAGKTFVSTASNDNLNLTIVTLNDPNTYENHKMLYEEIFNNYHNYLLMAKGVINVEVDDKIAFIENDIVYPLSNKEINNISKEIVAYPEQVNNVFGELKIYLKDKEIIREKIYLKDKSINNNKISLWEKIKQFFLK